MINNLGLYAFAFLLCITPSCKKTENSTTEIVRLSNIKSVEVKISELSSDMQVVQLETNENCLISYIKKIRYCNELIYIQDVIFKGIYVFNKHGKFVNKLDKQGRGPGEYLEIADFYINENSIEVLDASKSKILSYELPSFKYKSELLIPISRVFSFEKKEGVYYLHTHGLRNMVGGEKTNSDVIAFNPITKETVPLFDRLLSDDVSRSFNINGFSSNSMNELFFSKAWHNTFYKLNEMTATPILSVDAGGFEVPEAIKNGTYEEQEDYISSGESGKHYLLYYLSLYEKDKVFILFSKGISPFDFHYYIKNDGKEYVTKSIQIDFIEENPIISINQLQITGNKFIYTLMPDVEESSEMKRYMDRLEVKEGDNPILLTFRIK